MGNPVILLYAQGNAGLLIPWPSGVVFQQQTGGYACLQDTLEGVFVPLDNFTGLAEELDRFFTGPKWEGHCYAGIDAETADFVDVALGKTLGATAIRVDRDRLAESREAWVHLLVTDPSSTGLLEGFEPCAAVLTWPNSD